VLCKDVKDIEELANHKIGISDNAVARSDHNMEPCEDEMMRANTSPEDIHILSVTQWAGHDV
jgi:hypothetical protein